jgi:phosphatidylglycerol:prolipoprotein diacylglycerol transferase
MHPVLFEFNTPQFLRFLFSDTITIYSYGFFIALGAIFGYIYTAYEARKQFKVTYDTTQALVLSIIIAAVLGGKLFLIFEDPKLYLNDPGALLRNFGSGFVFYGSLLTAIPVMLIFFRRHKLPVLPMLDIMAVTACLVHGMGRMGCYMAGCCYGVPSEGLFGVTFTSPLCQADPLNTPLHPTQLYSAILIFGIAIMLIVVKGRKQFNGQLFMLYLMAYAIGRAVIEVFRGDLDRGYVIEDVLSNSQLISIIVFLGALWIYFRLRKTQKISSQ